MEGTWTVKPSALNSEKPQEIHSLHSLAAKSLLLLTGLKEGHAGSLA